MAQQKQRILIYDRKIPYSVNPRNSFCYKFILDKNGNSGRPFFALLQLQKETHPSADVVLRIIILPAITLEQAPAPQQLVGSGHTGRCF